jgi:ectoine hydroxylase-related dioxygenase (phytanoyl-CoA dioxygenase family)
MRGHARGLTRSEKKHYQEQGYVIVRGALGQEDLAPVIAEFEQEIDAWARKLHARRKLRSRYEEEGFETRLARISEESHEAFFGVFGGAFLGPALFGLLRHDKVLALMESLLGEELMCHPAFRVRPKLPDLELTRPYTVVPWHQDSAYLTEECDSGVYVTAWMSLTRSTVRNGCVEVIPGAHKQGILRHRNVQGRTYLDIVPSVLPRQPRVPVLTEPGDILLMHHLLPHRSLPNRTRRIRWSIDARYHRPEQPTGYPLEAGFLARSTRRPNAVVASVNRFARIRDAHIPGQAARWERWETERPR